MNEYCLNCGTELLDLYCHNCGQKDTPRRQTLIELIKTKTGLFLNIESSFLRNIGYLLFKPGFLPKEYTAGKRDSEADGFAARVENEQAWKVSVGEIKARNYNLDIKNPNVGEEISHDSEELLRQYEEQQMSISGLREQLKAISSEALTKNSLTTE